MDNLIYYFLGVFTTILGIILKNINIGNLLTDPYILEVYIFNPSHSGAPIGFGVKNNTQYRLKTDITITPIINKCRYFTEKYYEVINPDGEYAVVSKKLEYKYISHINEKYKLNAESYQGNKQPLKFELIAHFRNNRFQVMKIHNSTKILTAYEPSTKEFRQIE